MVDLYTALKLCRGEDYIMLSGGVYTHKQIKEKFDLRRIRVRKIYFDRWHNIIRFDTKNII